jgi:hypothetical protein
LSNQDDVLANNKGKFEKIPSSKITHEEIEKIWKTALQINTEAKNSELEYFRKFVPKGFDANMKKTELDQHMFVVADVWTENGVLTRTKNLQDLKSNRARLAQLTIENSSQYQLYFKFEPQHKFKIEMDFKTPSAPELLFSNSTQATQNKSKITVVGMNEIWVDGTFSNFQEHFRGGRIIFDALHSAPAYDFLLWLLFVPMWFLYFFKFNDPLAQFVISKSAGFSLLFYLSCFLFYLFCVRAIFNLCRWLWPYLEIKSEVSSARTNLRWLVSLIFLSWIAVPFLHAEFSNLLARLLGK